MTLEERLAALDARYKLDVRHLDQERQSIDHKYLTEYNAIIASAPEGSLDKLRFAPLRISPLSYSALALDEDYWTREGENIAALASENAS
jgi:hypothetical protein